LEQAFHPAKSTVRRELFVGRIKSLSASWAQWGSGERTTSTILAPLLSVVLTILLWSTSLHGVDLSRMNDLGLVSVLPLSFYAALIVLTISFCLVVQQQQARVPILLLHVIVLIIVIHGTPNILYRTLRYSWSWKHVGLVDYIQRHNSVDPRIATLSAYHNWPGFFALSALITEAAGLKSALSFAGWAPVFFNLIDLGVLLLIFRTFTQDRRLIWLSIWFFYLTNWVGQDYFSPQALNYFLHLVVLGVCLKWFKVTTPLSKSTIKRWLVFDWAASLFHSLVNRTARDDTADTTAQPGQRAGLIAIIVLLLVVIASSHQLTPLMTISALAALVVFQRCKARGLPILAIILMLTWIIYGAVVFLNGELPSIIESIGQLTDNVDSNLIDLSQVSPGQRLVAIMVRGLTVSVWGLALLGGIRRLRQGYWDLACMLLAVAPFAMLASNSYGGEMLFRVYLFALPFMAFFAAALLYPSPTCGRSGRTALTTMLLSGALLVGFCFAYYGKEQQYHFTEKEVDAAQYLYNVAPANSLLIEGSRNYPSQFQNYEHFTYVPIARESKETQLDVVYHPVDVLSRWMSNSKYTAAYLIITRSQKADVDTLGVMQAGSLDRVEKTLMQSHEFTIVYANEDAKIFTLANGIKEAELCCAQSGGR
jgi:hypothetical protein